MFLIKTGIIRVEWILYLLTRNSIFVTLIYRLINLNNLHSVDQGSGVPLFFQHGLTANTDQVKSLLSGLEGLRLISIDCPGHGLTPLRVNDTISFDTYSDMVVKNMDALGIQKGVFGGISMGSGIALNIALRYPERVLGLVLVRPAWLDTGSPKNLSILLEASLHIGADDGIKIVEELEAFQEIAKELPLAARSILGIFGIHQQDILPKVIKSMVVDHPLSNLEDLKGIKVPSLVIGNENDPLHPYDMAEVIYGSLNSSRIIKLTSGYIDKALHRNQVRSNILDFIKNEIQ